MEAFFSNLLEDIRHERSIIILLSIVEPDILRRSKFLDLELDNIKNITLEKLQRQTNLKEIIALELLQKEFSD